MLAKQWGYFIWKYFKNTTLKVRRTCLECCFKPLQFICTLSSFSVWDLIAKFSTNFSNCRIMLCAKSQWPPIWMVPLAITLLNGPLSSLGLRLTGEFEPSKNFFLFLAKFGFQMTDSRNKDESQGYIYGNITYQLPEENATTSNVSINSKPNFV